MARGLIDNMASLGNLKVIKDFQPLHINVRIKLLTISTFEIE